MSAIAIATATAVPMAIAGSGEVTETPGTAGLSLAQFQSAFAAGLLGPASRASPLAHLFAQPAFAVYRNTVMKGCVDALEANFPSVARLVGSDWFRAAAALHVAEAPPRDGRLLHYGAQFPDFLRSFAPAADLPYLCGVAQLDALWLDAHVAADAPVLAPASLTGLPPETLGDTVLALHPATHWRWFEDHPIYTLWQRNRPSGASPANGGEDAAQHADIDWQAEGALLTRCDGVVRWQHASRADCAFLHACAEGMPLAEAAAAASTTEPGADIAALLANLLRAKAFRAFNDEAVADNNQPTREKTKS